MRVEIFCERNSPSDEIIIIHEVLTKVGSSVEKDQPLLIAEGAKSLFEIVAPIDGVVAELNVVSGNSVKIGDLLVVIE